LPNGFLRDVEVDGALLVGAPALDFHEPVHPPRVQLLPIRRLLGRDVVAVLAVGLVRDEAVPGTHFGAGGREDGAGKLDAQDELRRPLARGRVGLQGADVESQQPDCRGSDAEQHGGARESGKKTRLSASVNSRAQPQPPRFRPQEL
ncbi:MAG: hypothetical protein BJ554DRAFT_3854, partial [Olpidium bornovanus]